MITLTVRNLKNGKIEIECYDSKDKAIERLDAICVKNPKFKVEGVSYDNDTERKIVEPILNIKKKENEQ